MTTKERAVLRVSDARLLDLISFAEKTDTRALGLGAAMDDIGLALMELSNRRAFSPEPAGKYVDGDDPARDACVDLFKDFTEEELKYSAKSIQFAWEVGRQLDATRSAETKAGSGS